MFTDIDECGQPEVCSGGRCTNTEGSYHCECDQGYAMVRKGHCQGKEWGAALPSPGPSPGTAHNQLPFQLIPDWAP